MVSLPLCCPFCGSDDVGKNGTSNGKQCYLCRNHVCSHKTFYAEYTYNGCKPDVKKSILQWSADGAGIRATCRGDCKKNRHIVPEPHKSPQRGCVAWQFPAGCLYRITRPCRRTKHRVLDQNSYSSLKDKLVLSVGDVLSTNVEGKDDMQSRFRYSLRDERCRRML